MRNWIYCNAYCFNIITFNLTWKDFIEKSKFSTVRKLIREALQLQNRRAPVTHVVKIKMRPGIAFGSTGIS